MVFYIINQDIDALAEDTTTRPAQWIVRPPNEDEGSEIPINTIVADHLYQLFQKIGDIEVSFGTIEFSSIFEDDDVVKKTDDDGEFIKYKTLGHIAAIRTVNLIIDGFEIVLSPTDQWFAVTDGSNIKITAPKISQAFEEDVEEPGFFSLIWNKIVGKNKKKTKHLDVVTSNGRGIKSFWNRIRRLADAMVGVQDRVQNDKVRWAFIRSFLHMQFHHWKTISTLQNILDPNVDIPDFTPSEHVPGIDCTVYDNLRVENWGKTYDEVVSKLFIPTTVHHIQQIIKYAQENQKSIRCTGYTHTWAPMYADKNEIIIAFIPPKATYQETVANDIHNVINPEDELHKIDEMRSIIIYNEDGSIKEEYGLLRVGAGARNYDLLQLSKVKHLQYTIPFNVILTETTFGGSTSMICHGAGVTSSTLPDIVHEIEFIDFDGNKRQYSRENSNDLMNSLAGGFGLFGVITHITFKLPKMYIARYSPYLLPHDEVLPKPARNRFASGGDSSTGIGIDNPNDHKIKRALKRLHDDMGKYYCEWFFYPFQDHVWVNCFDKIDRTPAIEEYHIPIMNKSDQYFGDVTYLGACFAKAISPSCPTCAQKMGTIAETSMPTYQQTFPTVYYPAGSKQDAKEVVLIEAVHFRRGIHAMQVRDMEAEIRIPDPIDGDDSIAMNMLRELWWAGINLAEEFKNQDKSPLTMALEMRLTGTSNATLGAQRYNNRTASIEVLSLKSVDEAVWEDFCCQLWTQWSVISGVYNRVPNAIKPHWAKEWTMLEKNGQINLSDMYKTELDQFYKHLTQYASEGAPARTPSEYFTKFGNKKLRDLFHIDQRNQDNNNNNNSNIIGQ